MLGHAKARASGLPRKTRDVERDVDVDERDVT